MDNQCDRCGKELEKDERKVYADNDLERHTGHHLAFGIHTIVVSDPSQDEIDFLDEVDLCRPCMNLFDEFWKGFYGAATTV